MDKLTIEQKAKAYDEAKARMSKAYNSNRCTIGFMNEIFPEFKDEDERIKEEIINYFECQSRDEPCRKSIHDKWIAWIEKQGQTFTKEEVGNANKVEPKDYNGIDPHFGKPADKVEPKFKVCEWLTENQPNSYARFMQILEIINVQGKKRYRISRDLHNDEDIVECRFVEDNWHSFNIRDIKDGDILVASDGSVFIYAGSTDIYAKFYVALTKCGILNLEGGNWEDKKSVYPAAKEQRERFFAAMHDAGYEFDFEKKKLKKIEQEPAWSEEDEKAINDILWIIEAYRKNGFNETHIQMADNSEKWLKSLKPQNWKPSEKQIMCLQDALSDYHRRGYKTETLETLLKQLKQL